MSGSFCAGDSCFGGGFVWVLSLYGGGPGIVHCCGHTNPRPLQPPLQLPLLENYLPIQPYHASAGLFYVLLGNSG